MRSFAIVLILIGLTSVVIGQDSKPVIAERFLKIRPVVSTKADVEKIYGKGESMNAFVVYRTKSISVFVTYASDPADCHWSRPAFPKDVVTEIEYDFHDGSSLKLKDTIKDFDAFKYRQTLDIAEHTQYMTSDRSYSVTFNNQNKRVLHIVLEATEEQEKQYKCTTSKPTRFIQKKPTSTPER